jgi:hypothetical protein
VKPDQKRYALSRIAQEVERRTKALKLRCTTKPKGASAKQKLCAVRCGDVNLRYGISLETRLKDAYDFRDLEASERFNQKMYDQEAAKIQSGADVVRDEIMLGDEKEALALIRKFCRS